MMTKRSRGKSVRQVCGPENGETRLEDSVTTCRPTPKWRGVDGWMTRPFKTDRRCRRLALSEVQACGVGRGRRERVGPGRPESM